jgi:S-DNA-T family DNA segregation ATPase FtsK/SpoIIIE
VSISNLKKPEEPDLSPAEGAAGAALPLRVRPLSPVSEPEAEAHTSLWDDMRDSLPPWLFEVLSIVVVVFGLLSFLALLNADNTTSASATWRSILLSLFGYGSWLIAVGIFLVGIYGMLQRLLPQLRLAAARVIALEVTFLCILALLHLAFTDGELRATARAGEGGGMIGWGLSALPYWLLGRSVSLVLFGFVLFICVLVLVGVRRAQVIHNLNTLGQRLLAYSRRISPPTPGISVVAPAASAPASAITQRRNPIMRIRPRPESLPPSQRAAPIAAPPPRDPRQEELARHPLFSAAGRELKVDFNIIGDLTNRKTEDGYRIVRRPDGREKRYFNVEHMKETKKVGKRDRTLPNLELLRDAELTIPDESEINRNVVLIENTLLEFDVDIDVVNVQVGPTVTRYAVQPYQTRKDGSTERTRLSKIASYASDLSLALSAKRLRLETPVPGTNFMGIEVPNKTPSVVTLRSVYESKTYHDLQQKGPAPLLIPLGRDVAGNAVAIDIAKMPHLLIAGTTGSGKSVCIAAMASALLLNNTPDTVKLIMLDPKMVELSRFNGLPHLLGPVETDTDRIIGVLKWCTREMDRRYKLLEEHAVRNIDNFNARFALRRKNKDYLPHIVILVDEIGDLMLSRPEETETAVTRLAQMARAVGMHLVVATQRPSVDVITGLIKANFPSRIAFSVASGVDSRVILDTTGAETLLGNGDMLFLASDAAGPQRLQGCYVSDEEVRQIVKHWVDWHQAEVATGRAEAVVAGPWERGLTRREFLAETDPMLEDAIEFVVESQEASASIIQRKLGLGYPRAARIMDLLEELGVVGETVGGGKARKVLIPRGEDPFKRIIEQRMKTGNKPLSTSRKPVEEYYDDDDIEVTDAEYYSPDDD